MNAPLEPPLSHHRRIHSASDLDAHLYHTASRPSSPDRVNTSPFRQPPNPPFDPSSSVNNNVATSPSSDPPRTVNNSPPNSRDINSSDLLAFLTHQQTLFQQERDYSRTALQEQHMFMAEQQRQFMSALVSRPSRDDDPQKVYNHSVIMTGLLRSTINQGAVYGATSATLAIYGYVYFRFFPDAVLKFECLTLPFSTVLLKRWKIS